jgi:DNA-binding beta-propeller fold protein YncE
MRFCIAPTSDRLYITDGNHDHGKVHVVDGTSFQVLKTVDLAPGAEQFGYDPGSGQLFVANGGHDANSPFGFVSVVDTRTAEKLTDIRVDYTEFRRRSCRDVWFPRFRKRSAA